MSGGAGVHFGPAGGAPTNEALLLAHRWRQHPYFVGLWNRDGGEYMSTSAAMAVEQAEQRARNQVRRLRETTGDEGEIRQEILDRRHHHDERVGPGRVVQANYNKGWEKRRP